MTLVILLKDVSGIMPKIRISHSDLRYRVITTWMGCQLYMFWYRDTSREYNCHIMTCLKYESQFMGIWDQYSAKGENNV